MVTISGPYGEFFIKDTDAEMIYIGGGAGMAPMRSHLFHLFHTLKTGRKVTYWYGGRSKQELFYVEDFKNIEREFPNFKFFVVLSDPLPEDNWVEKKDMDDAEGDGFLGFVHNAVIDQHRNIIYLDGLEPQMGQHGNTQVTMGNGRTVGALLFCPFCIHMNPLVIQGGIGKLVNLLLGNFVIFRCSQLFSHIGFKLIVRVDN